MQRTDRQGRLAETLRAAHNGLDARNQFLLVEGLGDEIIGAHAEDLHLGLRAADARQDQHRRFDATSAHAAHNFATIQIRQHQIQHDDVIIIEFGEFEGFFPRIRYFHNHGGMTKH